MPEVKGNIQAAAIAVHAACCGWAMKKAIAMTKAGNMKATMANGHRTSTLVLLEMKPTKNPLPASVMASSKAMATIVFIGTPFMKEPSVIDGLFCGLRAEVVPWWTQWSFGRNSGVMGLSVDSYYVVSSRVTVSS